MQEMVNILEKENLRLIYDSPMENLVQFHWGTLGDVDLDAIYQRFNFLLLGDLQTSISIKEIVKWVRTTSIGSIQTPQVPALPPWAAPRP